MKACPDTNVWLEWLRRPPAALALDDRVRGQVYVTTIALQELWAGASAAATPYLERLFSLARIRGRVLNPPGAAWILSGQVLAVLARTHHLRSARLRALRNDVLLAATAMMHGATVLTYNTADFALIGRVIPVRHRTPPH